MVTEHDAARYLEQAMRHESADERRDALLRLSKSRHAHHDVSIDTCSTIARTDPSPSVRIVAIRLIAESCRADVGQTVLEILEEESRQPSAVSRQLTEGRYGGGEERVEVESLHALYFLHRNEAIPKERIDDVVSLAGELLRRSASRDVRIAAARLLGEFPQAATLEALITGLEDPDFGVVYHVEQSLIRLTGVTHEHDPVAWRRWLDQTDQPFAMIGKLDPTLEPPDRKHWWQRMAASVKRALSGFRPKPSDG